MDELFGDWMEHFIKLKFAKPDPVRKTLLIVDGHVSHTQNLKAIQMARDAEVIMLSLPSHTTHRMQLSSVRSACTMAKKQISG